MPKVKAPPAKDEPDREQEEAKQDDAMRSRSAEYDPELTRRARAAGINPDNFETETDLRAAVPEPEETNTDEG